MKRLTLCSAAATAALLAHLPAFATASSSASITDFTIRLYDLNPMDGFGPSITFTGQSYSSTYAYDTAASLYAYDEQTGVAAFDPTAATSATALSNASTTGTGSPASPPITGDTTIVGALNANGSANSTSLPGSGYYTQYAANSAWNSYSSNGFTLSPYTLAVFTANASVSASTTALYDPNVLYGNQEAAWAIARIHLAGPGSSGNGSQSSFEQLYVDAYVYNCDPNLCLAPSFSATGSLGGTFLNNTGQSMSGSFYADVSAGGYSYAAAVPEPQTYGMMLAGLGMLGVMARRRSGR